MSATPEPSRSPRVPSRGLRARLRAGDPLLPVVCLAALGCYLLQGFDAFLTRDIGLYGYAGQQLADGVPPYVAVLNRAGPLAHLLPGLGALAARGLGVDELLGMRVLFMVVAVACVGVAYLLVRDALRSRLAGLAAAAALLSFHGVAWFATFGPREKTPLLLFLLLAMLAVVHQRWATAGVLVALATLTWQPAFAAAFTVVVVAVLLGLRSGRGTALLRVVVGGLVPPLLFVVTYAALGHLQLLIDDFLLINWRYTEQITYLDDPTLLGEAMEEGFAWTTWLLVGGALALPAFTVAALRRPASRRTAQTAALACATAGLAVGCLWLTKAFNGWADLFFLLPAVLLGVGCAVQALARLVSHRAALVATAAWCVAVAALTVPHALDNRTHELSTQRADVAAVLGALPRDDRQILSVSAPQPLLLAHQRNPSRMQLFGNGLVEYLDDTWPGGHQGFADWIGRRRTAVVAYGEDGVKAFTRPSIEASYTCVGHSPGWYWYLRSDLGADRLRTARNALADHSCPGG